MNIEERLGDTKPLTITVCKEILTLQNNHNDKKIQFCLTLNFNLAYH